MFIIILLLIFIYLFNIIMFIQFLDITIDDLYNVKTCILNVIGRLFRNN